MLKNVLLKILTRSKMQPKITLKVNDQSKPSYIHSHKNLNIKHKSL